MNTSRKSIVCSPGIYTLKMMLANWREIRGEPQGCEVCKTGWGEREREMEPNLLPLTKESDLIAVHEDLTRGRDFC